jgi:hypothetical protein
MTFRFLPPAARELDEAAAFYEAEVPGLGIDFLSEINTAIHRILTHPLAWVSIAPGIRRCRTARFPESFMP